MSEWCIRVQYDEVRGKHYWSANAAESDYTYRYYHLYYVLAIRGKDAYMHFTIFTDNCEGAHNLADRVRASPDFTPEGKPLLWFKIVDTKPQRLRKDDWRFLLWRTCWRMKWPEATKNTPLTTTSPDSSANRSLPLSETA